MPDTEWFPPRPALTGAVGEAAPGDVVQIADGFRLYREVHLHAQNLHGYLMDATVTWDEQRRRLVVSRLEVRKLTSGEPVTSEGLRAFALSGLPRRALLASIADGLTPSRLEEGRSTRAFGLVDSADAQACKVAGPVPNTLELVALVYRGAAAVGDPPTKAVRETFDISQSTAGAWVAAARKVGHLGAAEGPGKVTV